MLKYSNYNNLEKYPLSANIKNLLEQVNFLKITKFCVT